MQAKLIFDLSDYDDQIAHLRAVKSTDLALALLDIKDMLHKLSKYDPDNHFTQEMFFQIMDSRDINIHSLII